MKQLTKALAVGASRFAQQPGISWSKNDEPLSTGLRAWLMRGTGYTTVASNAAGGYSIECIGDSWAEANASDLVANREAAFESLWPRQHSRYSNKALAWPIVTTYYAAYFAAQSLLRCCGLGSVYLEADEADLLTAAWHARGFAASVTGGNYSFTIDLQVPVVIHLRRLGASGGAHQQFWAGFRLAQPSVHSVLLVSPALATLSALDRQAADSEYIRLIDACFTTPAAPHAHDYSWLSRLRNDLNYRFGGHAWLMNWHHSTGLIPAHESLIARYSSGAKSLPDSQRNFSRAHLGYVAARFCQLLGDATSALVVP